jgi:hypothetical protein
MPTAKQYWAKHAATFESSLLKTKSASVQGQVFWDQDISLQQISKISILAFRALKYVN